jgi:hypothetical protein
VHFVEAVLERVGTSSVDMALVANTIRVFGHSQSPACRSHILACRRCGDSRGILGVVDGLNAVGVVVSELGEEYHLCVNVDAGVDETDSIEMEWDGGGVLEVASGNLVVLLHEVVGCIGAPVSTVRLTPDTEAVIQRPVFGKPAHISCEVDSYMSILTLASRIA